jgi:uncharacterized protein YndB with AHSA1/START domain
MSIVTCPTEIVAAPQERVWELLTLPAELARWSGATLRQGRRRPLAAGDALVLGVGVGHWLKATIEVKAVEPLRQLTLDVRLPLGVVNHEVVVVTPLGTERCRVTFN